MRTVGSFGWTRASPVLVTQEAIAASTPSAGSLTIFDATACSAGDDYCQFSSILFVSSYTTLGVVVGCGIVSMLFDGARRLADNAGGLCSLQAADEAAGISESRVPIMMVQMYGASMSTIFAAIVGAVGVVAFLQVMWTNNRASE